MKVKLVCLVLLVVLTGCTDEHILEKSGFIRTIAYDKESGEPKDSMRVTISITKSNHQDAIVYSVVAKSDKDAKSHFDLSKTTGDWSPDSLGRCYSGKNWPGKGFGSISIPCAGIP